MSMKLRHVNGTPVFETPSGRILTADAAKVKIKRSKRLANVRAKIAKASAPPRKVKGQSKLDLGPTWTRDSAGRLRKNGRLVKDRVNVKSTGQEFLKF